MFFRGLSYTNFEKNIIFVGKSSKLHFLRYSSTFFTKLKGIVNCYENISINIPKLIFKGNKIPKSVKIVTNFEYILEFRES